MTPDLLFTSLLRARSSNSRETGSILKHLTHYARQILHFPFVKRPFFEAKIDIWVHLTKPRPPAPVVIFLDPTLYHSLYRTQLADAPGSADSEGLRPHAPTLEKRSQPNASFTQNPKLELNPKVQIERPISKRQTPSPNSQLKTQTELWVSPRSIFSCGTH